MFSIENKAVLRAIDTLEPVLVFDFEQWLIDNEMFFDEYKKAVADLEAAEGDPSFRQYEVILENTVLKLIKHFRGWLDSCESVNKYVDGVVEECKEEIRLEKTGDK